MPTPVDDCLERLASLHPRLCPRQVLAVRIGLHAATLLDLDVPRTDKRLFALVETDGCFADGVSVATGCWLGRRTLRLVDHGKPALILLDTRTSRAVRVWPAPGARRLAIQYAPDQRSRWHSQLTAYQHMAAEDLLRSTWVELTVDVDHLLGQPGVRVACCGCGEEILNGREVMVDGQPRCRACGGERYWRRLGHVASSGGGAMVRTQPSCDQPGRRKR
jgi:formylmethanofuran dehydrogenase subunit E